MPTSLPERSEVAQSEIGLLSVGRTRDLSAVVIPVHFAPSVPEGQVREILESLLGEAAVYCRPEHLLTVVDRGTVAERVLAEFPGLRIHRLERNKGKAGIDLIVIDHIHHESVMCD